jgi:hypothetical protein
MTAIFHGGVRGVNAQMLVPTFGRVKIGAGAYFEAHNLVAKVAMEN